MKRGTKRLIFVSLIVIGFVLLVDASTNVTGNAISEKIGTAPSYVLGLISAIAGILAISREIAGGGYEAYRVDIANIVADYKDNPSRKNAVLSARKIDQTTRDRLGNPIRGVYSRGDEAKIITAEGKKPIPVSFASEKEGKNLVRALARVALQNNPENEEYITFGKKVDVRKEVREFERGVKK